MVLAKPASLLSADIAVWKQHVLVEFRWFYSSDFLKMLDIQEMWLIFIETIK